MQALTYMFLHNGRVVQEVMSVKQIRSVCLLEQNNNTLVDKTLFAASSLVIIK
jgi:hypothetical protein